MGDSYGGEKIGVIEYHLNSNGDLLSYFKRDKNNQTIDSYKLDKSLQKEYEEQGRSDLRLFLKEKGYYLLRETSKRTISFGTATIVQRILEKLYLKPTQFFGSPSYLDSFKNFNGLFDNISASECTFKKVPVNSLTDNNLSILSNIIKAELNTNYEKYNNLADSTVIDQSMGKYMSKEQDVYLARFDDNLYFFDDNQYMKLKENISEVWNSTKDSLIAEREKKLQKLKIEIPKFAEDATEAIMKDVLICYGSMSEYGSQPYLNSLGNLMYLLNGLTGYNLSQSDIGQKFACLKPIRYYSIDDITLNKGLDTCIVYLSFNTDGHMSVIYEVEYKNNDESMVLLWNKSFESSSQVAPIWNAISELKNEAIKLDEQIKSYKSQYPQIVSGYKDEKISFKKNSDGVKTQYKYYNHTLAVQKGYLMLIDMVKQVNENTEKIRLLAADHSDIAKSYQGISKSWDMAGNLTEKYRRYESVLVFQDHCLNFIAKRNTISEKYAKISTNTGKDHADILKSFVSSQKNYNLSLSSDTSDNHTRLNNFIIIQDSCLIFIELRKSITQNNAKIAGYAKTAPTIVKTYNTYMKGVDLTWNQESGRNQAIREIIQMQNELIYALQKPNINEIDKTVKNSKAKTWEEVKKTMF